MQVQDPAEIKSPTTHSTMPKKTNTAKRERSVSPARATLTFTSFTPETSPEPAKKKCQTFHPKVSEYPWDHEHHAKMRTLQRAHNMREIVTHNLVLKDASKASIKAVPGIFHVFYAQAILQTYDTEGAKEVLKKPQEDMEHFTKVILSMAMYDKFREWMKGIELPTPAQIQHTYDTCKDLALHMAAGLEEQLGEKIYETMTSILNGKISSVEMTAAAAAAGSKMLPAYYALHILESSSVGYPPKTVWHSMALIKDNFKIALSNALNIEYARYEFEALFVSSIDIDRVDVMCKEAVYEALGAQV